MEISNGLINRCSNTIQKWLINHVQRVFVDEYSYTRLVTLFSVVLKQVALVKCNWYIPGRLHVMDLKITSSLLSQIRGLGAVFWLIKVSAIWTKGAESSTISRAKKVATNEKKSRLACFTLPKNCRQMGREGKEAQWSTFIFFIKIYIWHFDRNPFFFTFLTLLGFLWH